MVSNCLLYTSKDPTSGMRLFSRKMIGEFAWNLNYGPEPDTVSFLILSLIHIYISRVLGADGTGIQSYTNSVVQYFAILAALGTASYGQREIARHRDDLKMRSRLFWEIEMLCMATTAACLIIWLFVIGFAKEYRPYYIVLTMTLTAVAFDISWFFGGLEQYSLIVLRNTAVKLIGIAMLLSLIHI